mgnify:CR=1 FL=1
MVKAEADGVEAVRLYDAEVVVDRMLVEAEGRGELGLKAGQVTPLREKGTPFARSWPKRVALPWKARGGRDCDSAEARSIARKG